MIRALACLAFWLSAPPAFALSCAPFTPVDAFLEAQDSAAAYTVVVGQVAVDPAALPGGGDDAPGYTLVPARVVGRALSYAGFVTPVAYDVFLSVECVGPWCGGLAAGEEQLMFLEQADGGLLLRLSPCAPLAFPSPDERDLATMSACLRGMGCGPTGTR